MQCMVSLTFHFTGLLIQAALKMQERLEVGSHVFIVESNRTVTVVIVAARKENFYTLRFLNGGAIQLGQCRIFLLREKAEKKMMVSLGVKRKFNSPYDYYGN